MTSHPARSVCTTCQHHRSTHTFLPNPNVPPGTEGPKRCKVFRCYCGKFTRPDPLYVANRHNLQK